MNTNDVRVIRILSWVIGCIALAFLATGLVTFWLLALPETRDLRIAENDAYPIYTASVTRFERSNLTVSGQRMYRLVFTVGGQQERTNPIFSETQALAEVGNTLRVRISEDGRAVMLHFRRSGNSIVGFVFLGVFGGLGAAGLISVIIMRAIANKRDENRL